MRFFSPAPASRSTKAEGRPLPSHILRRARVAFGHDFSHVRVTTGRPPGGPDTLAAAWGDRIALDSRVDDEPPLVRDFVLGHEVAHVAQQASAMRAAGAVPFDQLAMAQHEHAHLEANANAAALSMLAGQRSSILTAPLTLSRCARPAGGMITPAHFRFQTTVPIGPGDGDPAGWQACAIRASMSKDVGGAPYGQIFCIFEVGVPLRNYLGPVSRPYAQQVAASAANSAAYTVLSSGTPPTDATCIMFRRLMQEEMAVMIPGSRVSAHVSSVPLVNFP
jgi:hypothetical protein